MGGPHRVALTGHATERAARYTVAPRDVADLILERHARRRRNSGAADWIVRRDSGRVVGLEYWQASERLPGELLDALQAPPARDVVVERQPA